LAEDATPGRRGEDLACAHLQRSGMVVVARNFRTRAGEIDVVAREGDTLVFVEVKERRTRTHGSAIEAVTRGKRQRFLRAARAYAAAHGATESPVRFDVIAIDWDGDQPRLRHERGAFGED
jgi:putative endonuclease